MRILPPMQHSPGFLAVVDEARTRVNEVDLDQARERLANNPDAILMDVREDREWMTSHAADAVHLGKGILERDIESAVPDKGAEVIMYTNVHSLIGGYKALVNAGWEMEGGE